MTTATVVLTLLVALVAGASGYFISFKFNSSSAANNTNGDFGTPRGGFFALGSGMLIGMMSVHVFKFILPAADLGVALIVALVVGLVAGVVGMFRGGSKRGK